MGLQLANSHKTQLQNKFNIEDIKFKIHKLADEDELQNTQQQGTTPATYLQSITHRHCVIQLKGKITPEKDYGLQT